MIKSFIPGRIRFACACLKNAEKMAELENKMKALPGFSQTVSNPRTGSLTVYYDAETVPMADIDQWLNDHAPECKRKPAKQISNCPVSKSKTYYRAMSLAFVLCLVSPAAGMWHAHRYGAYLFTLMLAKHTYDYRRRIV